MQIRQSAEAESSKPPVRPTRIHVPVNLFAEMEFQFIDGTGDWMPAASICFAPAGDG